MGKLFSPGVLYVRLVGGDFHVGLRGVTDRTGSDDFTMDVRVSVRARAYCD